MEFYLAQLSGALAWTFLLISYWKNGNNKLLYLQVISCFFFVVNYAFLGALSGGLIVLFEMFRDFLYTKVKDPMKVFYICIPFYLIISIFSFEGFISLFSVFASLCDAYALTKKNKKVVVLGIFTYVLWLIYDFMYASYSTIIPEIFLIISNVVVLINYRKAYLKSDKLTFSRGLSFSTKLIDEFYKIDNSNFNSNYNWPKDKIKKIIKDRKTDYIFIKDKDDIIGYVNFIRITENKFNEMLNNNTFVDIIEDDVKKFSRKTHNYININAIAIKNSYQNVLTIKLVSNSIKDYLKNKNRYYKIKGIIAIAASDFENQIFEYSKFKKETKEINYHYVYTLENDNLNNYLKKDYKL